MEAVLTTSQAVIRKVSVRNNRLLFAICFLSSMMGGTVSTIMAVYLPSVIKEFSRQNVFSESMVSSIINAAFILGWTFGGVCLGIVGDKAGRKKSFILATATYGLCTLLTGIASSWQWVAIFRFLSGFGIGGVLVITTILISETFSGKQRAVLLGILSISIPVGIFSAGVLNYFVNNWRYSFSIGIFPILVALIAIFRIHELENKLENVTLGLQNNHRLFKGHNGKNLLVGTIIFGTALIGLWAVFSWMPYWIQTLIDGTKGQKNAGIAMMLMGAGGLSGGFVSGWLVNLINVKRVMLICFGACFFLCLFLFRLTDVVGVSMFIQIAFLAFFFGISQGALSVYIPELFPSNLAATATGLCFNIGRLFTATAVFYIGSLVNIFGDYGSAIFAFSFVFLIGFIFTLINKHRSNSKM